MSSSRLASLWVVLLALMLGNNASADASFEGLGVSATVQNCHAVRAVSGDGNVVVGSCVVAPGTDRAWRWTREAGIVAIDPPPGDLRSRFEDVSHDGLIAAATVGVRAYGASRAYRWSVADGWYALEPDLPTFIPDTCPTCTTWLSLGMSISPDASFMGGFLGNVSFVFWDVSAFRWSGGSAEVFLHQHAMNRAYAVGVTNDGAMAVITGSAPTYRFHYLSPDGISTETGARVRHLRAGISADGSTLVGGGYQTAFRWTSEEGVVELGPIPGIATTVESTAFDVSADGSVIVGEAHLEDCSGECVVETRVFVWTQARGIRDLELELELQGVDLGDWTLTSAADVSADGSVIVGEGLNPAGQPEGWRAVLPEPSAHLLHAAALCVVALSRRRAVSQPAR